VGEHEARGESEAACGGNDDGTHAFRLPHDAADETEWAKELSVLHAHNRFWTSATGSR
jgi:hypothetical protein